MRRVGAFLLTAGLIAACSAGNAAEETKPTDPPGSMPPTERALAVNEELLLIPAGMTDCGATVMTSGWPTTTMFNPEVSARCIMDAVAAGTPAQYAYWGRDGTGGLQGVVIRVDDDEPVNVMEYQIDAAGLLYGTFAPCASLISGGSNPPSCG